MIEAVLTAYRAERVARGSKQETFIDTVKRVGLEPFKAAANSARFAASSAAVAA